MSQLERLNKLLDSYAMRKFPHGNEFIAELIHLSVKNIIDDIPRTSAEEVAKSVSESNHYGDITIQTIESKLKDVDYAKKVYDSGYSIPKSSHPNWETDSLIREQVLDYALREVGKVILIIIANLKKEVKQIV